MYTLYQLKNKTFIPHTVKMKCSRIMDSTFEKPTLQIPYFWRLSNFFCSICQILSDCQDSQHVFISLWSYGWSPPVQLEAKLKTAGTHPKVPIFVCFFLFYFTASRCVRNEESWQEFKHVCRSLGDNLALWFPYRTESWGQKSWMVCQTTASI